MNHSQLLRHHRACHSWRKGRVFNVMYMYMHTACSKRYCRARCQQQRRLAVSTAMSISSAPAHQPTTREEQPEYYQSTVRR